MCKPIDPHQRTWDAADSSGKAKAGPVMLWKPFVLVMQKEKVVNGAFA
jgi:hypothetical protein